jgi:hypothetical protein
VQLVSEWKIYVHYRSSRDTCVELLTKRAKMVRTKQAAGTYAQNSRYSSQSLKPNLGTY